MANEIVKDNYKKIRYSGGNHLWKCWYCEARVREIWMWLESPDGNDFLCGKCLDELCPKSTEED